MYNANVKINFNLGNNYKLCSKNPPLSTHNLLRKSMLKAFTKN